MSTLVEKVIDQLYHNGKIKLRSDFEIIVYYIHTFLGIKDIIFLCVTH